MSTQTQTVNIYRLAEAHTEPVRLPLLQSRGAGRLLFVTYSFIQNGERGVLDIPVRAVGKKDANEKSERVLKAAERFFKEKGIKQLTRIGVS